MTHSHCEMVFARATDEQAPLNGSDVKRVGHSSGAWDTQLRFGSQKHAMRNTPSRATRHQADAFRLLYCTLHGCDGATTMPSPIVGLVTPSSAFKSNMRIMVEITHMI